MKKSSLIFILFVSLLVMQFGFIPNTFAATEESTKLKTSQIPFSSVRIAIYDDVNITIPSYTSVGGLTNNHSNVQNALISAGFEVYSLTTNQIYNHELITANYDVFIMADHLPRENITNYVKEFWLGGGALLSMDSAISFLCYFGILPPESAGNDGYSTYWTYQLSSVQNITARHPISKAYALNDNFTIDNSISSATFSWTALQGSSIGNEVVKVATRPGLPNAATVVAFDPVLAGGKVVHLPSPRQIEDDEILIDTIEWLYPHPKGRIAFDMTHNPRLGVDLWDYLTAYPGYYSILRDDLVSRDYLFDKLYPSPSGNLTLTRLNHYDMLIVISPDANYTSNDRNALTTWVHNGGGLLVFGENPLLSDFAITNARLHFLLTSFDIIINDTIGFMTTTDLVGEEHPSVEGCTDLTVDAYGALNITGTAYPIWKYGTHTIVAGQESQSGRIIMVADMNWCTNAHIADGENEQYAINIVNWLTADDAKVLIFVHNPSNPDPNDNIYRGPVATALNELGCSFYMTFTEEYLNLSLSTGSYKLVVIDNSEYSIMDTVGTPLLNFLKAGGYMIISTYEYRLTGYNYLWDYIGFTYAGNYFSSPQSINIWDPTHAIFTSPVPYSATTLNTSLDFVNTDYTNLTLHSNATGIAGLTPTSQVNGSAIIIGANKHVITNAMHLTEYFDDTDDDTYPDALQLWANEIAYMLTQINPPTAPTGIPGYDIFTVSLSIFFSISILSLVYIRKRKIHTN